jgi:GntR family transcriptional regulator, transcriptional repressor for pyruvate dehydrogenase complex
MLKALPRRKIRDEVVERLKAYIVSQKLVPGDRLPTEVELATTFGISRLSLREATKALEFLGIVESKTGVGLTVGQLDMERMTDHLGFHPALYRATAVELIDTRVVVEVGALPYTAQRMAHDSSTHARLQAIVDRFRATRELQEWIDLDIEFHRALLDASGLTPLVAFSDLLQVFFQRFRDSVKKAEWKVGIETHQRIIDALQDQDVVKASSELRRHIESHKKRVGIKE